MGITFIEMEKSPCHKLKTFSSLTAPGAVVMTTFGPTSGEKFLNMTTFRFKICLLLPGAFQLDHKSVVWNKRDVFNALNRRSDSVWKC